MTNNAFLAQMRAYAALAQRKHTSYAAAVHSLLAARKLSITNLSLPQDMEDVLLEKAESAVLREYAPVDPAFDIDASASG